jgi:hypothetical protein
MDFRQLINKLDSISNEAKKEPERLAFDDAIKHVEDIVFTPPLASGIKHSSANNVKFQGQDINDPKVKLALFQHELTNSPARLLGEIASRIKPTSDAQMDLSGHVGRMSEKLATSDSNHLSVLNPAEKTLAVEVIKKALRGMQLERDPDQTKFDDNEGEDEFEGTSPIGKALKDVEVNEGMKEIYAVVDAIKKVAERSDEVRQWIEGSLDKPLADITDQEIYDKIMKPGMHVMRAGAKLAPQALKQIGYSVNTIISYADMMPTAVASELGDMLPAMVNATDPTMTKNIAIKLNVEKEDIDALVDTYKELKKTFPQVAQKLEAGDFDGALTQLIFRLRDGLGESSPIVLDHDGSFVVNEKAINPVDDPIGWQKQYNELRRLQGVGNTGKFYIMFDEEPVKRGNGLFQKVMRADGSVMLVPLAIDGTPIWTGSVADTMKDFYLNKGFGLPVKSGGDYRKLGNRWMTQDQEFRYRDTDKLDYFTDDSRAFDTLTYQEWTNTYNMKQIDFDIAYMEKEIIKLDTEDRLEAQQLLVDIRRMERDEKYFEKVKEIAQEGDPEKPTTVIAKGAMSGQMGNLKVVQNEGDDLPSIILDRNNDGENDVDDVSFADDPQATDGVGAPVPKSGVYAVDAQGKEIRKGDADMVAKAEKRFKSKNDLGTDATTTAGSGDSLPDVRLDTQAPKQEKTAFLDILAKPFNWIKNLFADMYSEGLDLQRMSDHPKLKQAGITKAHLKMAGADAQDADQEEVIKKVLAIRAKELGILKDDVNEGDNIYHSCVTSFKHNKFGEGKVISGEHTLLEDGTVTHYDATFTDNDGKEFIVRNIPVKNMHECVIVEHGHPKKKKKVKEAHYQDFKQKVITVNKDVELTGDSIWDKENNNPKSVHVKAIRVTYEIDTESDDAKDRDTTYVSVHVNHDGPWEIYTDSGFEHAISQMIGINVDFTEQGMQDDGEASLEGSIATKDIPADAKPMEPAVPAEDWFQGQTDVTLNGDEFYETFGWVGENEENIEEAEYQGRTVKLNKPMRGDVKKFKVYVKNPKGNVVKVNFGDPDMKIKKSNPARRRSFRARHNCDSPGPKHKARYWSCRKW